MLNLIQAGTGPIRVFVIAYFIADRAALLRELPPSYCVVTDVDNPNGRFARAPGPGGIDTLEDAILWARYKAGAFEVSGVLLIGWSAGAQAVREQLRAGARPLAALALDGCSGSVPPTPAQLEPWQRAAERARAGEMMLVLTHGQMLYTEHLPPADRYLATVNGCRAITGWQLPEAGPLDAPVITRDGSLVVASYQSGNIDAQAHRDQQHHAMPDMLRRFVVPWLQRRGEPASDTQPPPTPPTRRDGLLRRGDSGPQVAAWQALLTRAGYPCVADGDFGPRTESATRSLQHDAGLIEDALVGPFTRAAAERRAKERETIPFIAARNFTPVPVSSPRNIDLIVIHTAETDVAPGAARAVASWFAGPAAPRASAHYVVGPDEVIACVRETDVAWAAPGANHNANSFGSR